MPTAGSTHPVRVQLVGLPGMLRSIIRGILAQQPDISLVAPSEDLDEALRERNADVVVAPIRIPAPLEQAHTPATADKGEPRLIGVSRDGRHVVVFHTDISPEGLVHTIRTTASVEKTEGADSEDTTAFLADWNGI
jgi:hypothetical protein